MYNAVKHVWLRACPGDAPMQSQSQSAMLSSRTFLLKRSLDLSAMQGMTTVKLPMSAFRVSGLMWGPDGGTVLLRDLNRFVVAFVEMDAQALAPEP